MTHIRNTVAAVVAAASLSLVAACGDLEPPATDIGKMVQQRKGPAPEGPTWNHPGRMDFGDGEATLPAKPRSKSWVDRNPSRLDFGDDGQG
jgi:hypothetical protein